MKKLIGRKVQIVVDGIGPMKATWLREMRDKVIVKGEGDDEPTYIPKSKIGPFKAIGDDGPRKPLLVFACENTKLKCPGVRFIREGEESKQVYSLFMADCPAIQDDCRGGCLGDVYEFPAKELAAIVSGTLYGDYPEVEQEEKDESAE